MWWWGGVSEDKETNKIRLLPTTNQIQIYIHWRHDVWLLWVKHHVFFDSLITNQLSVLQRTMRTVPELVMPEEKNRFSYYTLLVAGTNMYLPCCINVLDLVTVTFNTGGTCPQTRT